jgi:YspA, cpYpsA-related SLOG family
MANDGRILVTGSRDWLERAALYHALRVACGEFQAHRLRLIVVHGGCPSGADMMTHDWATAHPQYGAVPVIEEIHRANWNGPAGKGAGPWRNRQMVDRGADVCLAFIRNQSRGATHCAEYAEKAGIEVRYYLA